VNAYINFYTIDYNPGGLMRCCVESIKLVGPTILSPREGHKMYCAYCGGLMTLDNEQKWNWQEPHLADATRVFPRKGGMS
jgi:hypothetical protein